MREAYSQLTLTSGVSTGAFSYGTGQLAASEAVDEPPQPAPLLAEYAAVWLESISGLVRPRTLEGYTYWLEQHVLPRLGERRLDEIGVDDLLALISELLERGYTGWSI